MTTFNVGDRVVWVERSNLETHNEYEDDDVTRGVIKAVEAKGKVRVKWDYVWDGSPNPSSIATSKLMLESEANEILSKLEAEYEAYAGPIRKKIEKAAKLLEEANELAAAQDRDLTEWSDVVDPLIGAMDTIGWRTSSLSC